MLFLYTDGLLEAGVSDDNEFGLDRIEALVRVDKRVYHEHRVGRRHVAVHRSVRDEQLALQVLDEELIGLIVVVGRAVRVLLEESLPFLTPVVLVIAVVVIPGL